MRTHRKETARNDDAKDGLVEANVLVHPPDELDDALGISCGIGHLFQSTGIKERFQSYLDLYRSKRKSVRQKIELPVLPLASS